MFRPVCAPWALRLAAMAGALWALQACSSIPTIPLAKDGGINQIGESATGNYLAGRQAGLEQDTATAAKYFNRALSADPSNQTILERAFLLDVAAGDVAEGAALARKVASASPDNRVARLIVGIDAIKHRNYVEAVSALDGDGKADGADIIWATIRAWADAGQGRTDEALALMRTDDVKTALGAFGSFHEAMILDYAGRKKDAEAAYAAAVSASQGKSVRVLEAFGSLLEREGKRGEAIKLYNTYLSLVPDHPVIVAALDRAKRGQPATRLVKSPAEGAAEALYGLAVVLAGEQTIELPIVYTQLALYLAPDLAPGHALLGDLYEQQNNWEKAVASFSQISPGAPVAELAAVSIARDLSRLDKTAEGIALLKTWAQKDPQSVDIQVTLGDLYRAQEKWDLAAACYDAALKFLPQSDPRSWQIIYAKGISLERGGKWDQAEPLLQQALKLQPDQPQVLNYLGYSWIDRGEKLKEALSLIDRAVAQRPDDGYVVDSLGWAYYRLGDYQTAVYYLEHAVELKADDPTINDHLGDAYWRIGRRLEARFQWSHALTYNPSDDEAKAIKLKLEDGLADLKSSTSVAAPTRAASK
ncbi:MAG TPA: tetratricopeptide repeat protein [Alphaproteobacteria bacterium]|nr:tetratricopeptide repeat protein [Alphaproteobacteria bacterium]